jgi:hypothetical protein
VDELSNYFMAVAGTDLTLIAPEDGDYAGVNLQRLFSETDWVQWGHLKGLEVMMARLHFSQWLVQKVRDADPTDPDHGVWRLVMDRVIQFGIPPEGHKQLDLGEALRFLSVDQVPFEIKTVSFRRRNTQHEDGGGLIPGREGLAAILPVSGFVPGDGEDRLFCYQLDNGNIYRCTFAAKALHFGTLEEHSTRLSPFVFNPFIPTATLSEAELQTRRIKVQQLFDRHEHDPMSNQTYLQEMHYFVPVLLALSLQQRGHYTAALDWFRAVYDYSASPKQRKIYPGLDEVVGGGRLDRRGNDWLTDPLHPHAIATVRPDTYTRFTLQAIIRCLLDYADHEFSRDTAESVPRARQLYLTALELLQTPELQQSHRGCNDLIGNLSIVVGDSYWTLVVGKLNRSWRG